MNFPAFIAPPDAFYARHILRRVDSYLDKREFLCLAIKDMPYPYTEVAEHVAEFHRRMALVNWIQAMLGVHYTVVAWHHAEFGCYPAHPQAYRKGWTSYLLQNLENLP